MSHRFRNNERKRCGACYSFCQFKYFLLAKMFVVQALLGFSNSLPFWSLWKQVSYLKDILKPGVSYLHFGTDRAPRATEAPRFNLQSRWVDPHLVTGLKPQVSLGGRAVTLGLAAGPCRPWILVWLQNLKRLSYISEIQRKKIWTVLFLIWTVLISKTRSLL